MFVHLKKRQVVCRKYFYTAYPEIGGEKKREGIDVYFTACRFFIGILLVVTPDFQCIFSWNTE